VNPDAIGVMGWSQGGTDALLAAGQHPEMFKSIVTWAGAPSLKMDGFFGDAQYEEAKKNGYFVMKFDWRDDLEVSLQWCEDVMNTDVLKVFSAFTGPVLAIAGKNDTTVDPSWSDKIVAANANGKSKTFFIDGMDHTFNVFSEQDLNSLKSAIDATGAFFKETLG
jgi:dienelactone hydrolase